MDIHSCGKLRQGDEWYCALCHMRWEVQATKPPCAPVETPQNLKPETSKIRFRQQQKRAKRFRGYR